MRSLADRWECDPSNATWIVDRLEKLGLAERRGAPHDRRVKLVGLTPNGEKTKRELLREFHQPPPELVRLDDEDLQALDGILAKLGPASSSLDRGAPPMRRDRRGGRAAKP